MQAKGSAIFLVCNHLQLAMGKLNQIGYGHGVNMYACTSVYAILLQCLLVLVDDDDVGRHALLVDFAR